MLKNYLSTQFQMGRMASSWLIDAGDCQDALLQLEDFIQSFLLPGGSALEYNPDYCKIARSASAQGNLNRNILVDQLAVFRESLYKTSVTGNYRAGVIVEADLMNLHAANSCLKILEEAPKHCYIFLVTTRGASILPTIRSRCSKISLQHNYVASQTYEQILPLLSTESGVIEHRVKFLENFADKNRDLWKEFAGDSMWFLSKLIKRLSGVYCELSQPEELLFKQYAGAAPALVLRKYDEISDLIYNVTSLDLDLKSATLLLFAKIDDVVLRNSYIHS